MNALLNKKILLGVTGGIAAYKAAELTRLFIKQGAQVRVVMTQAATEFVQPLTFQALSGNEVSRELLNEKAEQGMGHIELARWADVIVIAPATADFIAKYQNGLADNLLLAVLLASDKPVFIAPAMNEKMYQHAATQYNLKMLSQRKVNVLGPAQGEQACGDVGFGRMLEPTQINEAINEFFAPKILTGKRILITAGPTHEAIDPVRYIANKSSGKMGFALAQAAVNLGATVQLIVGPVQLQEPKSCERINVVSAQDMYDSVMKEIKYTDIFIACAAVADYSPARKADQKIKKSESKLTLELNKTQDILSAVTVLDSAPFTVGFAAETQNVQAYAQKKLQAKNCDVICANDVSDERIGFASDSNAVTAFWNNGEQQFLTQPKLQLAKHLLQLIHQLHQNKKR